MTNAEALAMEMVVNNKFLKLLEEKGYEYCSPNDNAKKIVFTEGHFDFYRITFSKVYKTKIMYGTLYYYVWSKAYNQMMWIRRCGCYKVE